MGSEWNSHWPQSTALRALPVREQAKVLMKCVTARFPSTQLPPESVSAFLQDWTELIKSNGTDRFLIGVQRACQSTTFFPVLGDIVKHIPPPPIISTRWTPTPEDERRREAGERSYGEPDVKFMAALHVKTIEKHKRAGRPARLSEDELNGLLIELDRAINAMEGTRRQRATTEQANVRTEPPTNPTLFDRASEPLKRGDDRR